jgi:acyl carrier protein
MPVETMTERVRRFLVERFPQAKHIGADDSLLASGLIDSLAVLDIVGFLESEFRIVVSDDELVADNFQTIRSLAAFAESKMSGPVGKE